MRRKERLDVLLQEQGLAESREQARRLILAGKVIVAGIHNPKPGQRIPVDTALQVTAPERFVSRGGLKLEAALAAFALPVDSQVCADIGASTGGFTDCFLQHGAARVYAVDVGASQLHQRLRTDARVVVVDHCNARELQEDSLPEIPAVIAADLSFISLEKVLPALGRIAGPHTALVALVKPQFEATRVEVSRGKGVIRDPAVHRRVLLRILEVAPQLGWQVVGMIPSPVAGGSGNLEFLIHAQPGTLPSAAIDIDAVVNAALLHR